MTNPETGAVIGLSFTQYSHTLCDEIALSYGTNDFRQWSMRTILTCDESITEKAKVFWAGIYHCEVVVKLAHKAGCPTLDTSTSAISLLAKPLAATEVQQPELQSSNATIWLLTGGFVVTAVATGLCCRSKRTDTSDYVNASLLA